MSIQRYGFDSFGPSHPGGVLIPAPAGQYVLYDDHLAAVAEVAGLSDEAIYNDGYDTGVKEERKRSALLIADAYAAGVQAARDAVAALPRWGKGPSDRDDALAAIDALKEDK